MRNSVRGGEGPAEEIIISITISLSSLHPALPFIFLINCMFLKLIYLASSLYAVDLKIRV